MKTRLSVKGLLALGVCLIAMVLMHADGAKADQIAVGMQIKLDWGESTHYGGGPFSVYLEKHTKVDFYSFCASTSTYFSPGSTYYITNYGRSADAYTPSGAKTKVTLTEIAACIYTAFRDGKNAIAGYTNKQIQEAIWAAISPEQSRGVKNALYLWAQKQIASGNWKGYGNVVLLSLNTKKDGTGTYVQPQLALVPEPATVLLMGLGLLGLRAARRKEKFLNR